MKVTSGVIFSLICLAAVSAHPAKPEGSSEEVEFIPLEGQNPIVDTAAGGWSPFDGLFESLAGMMARMRQQMDYILRRMPLANTTSDESPFLGFPGIDLTKGNTTSVTKVIDGHKVVINETEYKDEGPNHGAFFKVRIIDVLPDSSELTTEKNAEEITPKDTESVENSYENEIPKNREIEVFEQPARSYQPFQKLTDGSSKWSTIETFDDVDGNSIESAYRPPDLTRDTYINQVMADAGAPTNPDAEVFSNVEYMVPYGTLPRRPIEKTTNPR